MRQGTESSNELFRVWRRGHYRESPRRWRLARGDDEILSCRSVGRAIREFWKMLGQRTSLKVTWTKAKHGGQAATRRRQSAKVGILTGAMIGCSVAGAWVHSSGFRSGSEILHAFQYPHLVPTLLLSPVAQPSAAPPPILPHLSGLRPRKSLCLRPSPRLDAGRPALAPNRRSRFAARFGVTPLNPSKTMSSSASTSSAHDTPPASSVD